MAMEATSLPQFSCAEDFLSHRRPVNPVRCFRPFAVTRAAKWFQSHFSGQLIYAVKANPAPFVIDALVACGVKRFDVASLAEIELIASRLPQARLFYMNPVKSRAHIRAAYFEHGVRRFAIDHLDEALKILKVTDAPDDLTFFVRLSCNDTGSILPLGTKYGVEGEQAIELLQFAREHAAQLGVTFHVGSQAMVPARYGDAITHVADLLARADVKVDRLNVGGGFPIFYKEGDPKDLSEYLQTCESFMHEMPLAAGAKIFAEPGRALAAEGESLIVRVDARRGNELYINDGGYGVLFDAAHSNWVFPSRLIGRKALAVDTVPYTLWGPTCDAADRMQGPFYLPACLEEGDYLEIYKTGAYGWSMGSQFNGFGTYEEIILEDEVVASNFVDGSSV